MKKKYLLEITVESLEAAAAAERGGADRIELCRDLATGGLTPDVDLFRRVRSKINLPIFVMIRPRAGSFVYSEAEFIQMKEEIVAMKSAGASAIVLGVLTSEQRVDVQRTAELVEAASPLPVTFHRAFDECDDQLEELAEVVKSGATRLLTSGSKKTALEGAAQIVKLVKAAGPRITIVPGAGITSKNIAELAHVTGATQFHAGLSSVVQRPQADLQAFEEAVRQLVSGLKELAERKQGDSPAEN